MCLAWMEWIPTFVGMSGKVGFTPYLRGRSHVRLGTDASFGKPGEGGTQKGVIGCEEPLTKLG